VVFLLIAGHGTTVHLLGTRSGAAAQNRARFFTTNTAVGAQMVRELGDIVSVLDEADPDDKAELYTQLGLRITYGPAENTARAEVILSPQLIGESKVSEAYGQPLAHALDLSTAFALDGR
jgi:hypothetical protein